MFDSNGMDGLKVCCAATRQHALIPASPAKAARGGLTETRESLVAKRYSSAGKTPRHRVDALSLI
ncbi:unnamed protein product [Mycetohabitans rhizoxinica HKI 454]|uniref:Uncharacterized protein n=1 Tax=Mycetohabitans rhizoxinica (strain DSM 19002 / CIP 109453 / HKI 454) TaxID=882378 RepID=E5AMY3_MYCRK|nr:unnamed protein product [Mycetohabitans rhizoxinica HKI 454]